MFIKINFSNTFKFLIMFIIKTNTNHHGPKIFKIVICNEQPKLHTTVK